MGRNTLWIRLPQRRYLFEYLNARALRRADSSFPLLFRHAPPKRTNPSTIHDAPWLIVLRSHGRRAGNPRSGRDTAANARRRLLHYKQTVGEFISAQAPSSAASARSSPQAPDQAAKPTSSRWLSRPAVRRRRSRARSDRLASRPRAPRAAQQSLLTSRGEGVVAFHSRERNGAIEHIDRKSPSRRSCRSRGGRGRRFRRSSRPLVEAAGRLPPICSSVKAMVRRACS